MCVCKLYHINSLKGLGFESLGNPETTHYESGIKDVLQGVDVRCRALQGVAVRCSVV